jgi:hypothetical protein
MKDYFIAMATESTKTTKSYRKSRGKAERFKDDSRMERLKDTSKSKTVAFGSWRVKAHALPLREAIARVESSNSALLRAKKTLVTSGVKLSHRKDVPLYRADPKRPDVLIREINGRTERVHLIDGEFKPVE